MNIIDSYILKQLIKPFMAGVAAFVVIMLSNMLFLYAEMIVKSGMPVKSIISLLLYSLPAIMVVTFPVAFMFATLLILGRLAKDSEILALRACGISFTRVITPVLLIATALSGLGFVINDTIVPQANNQTMKIQLDLMNQSLPPVKERVFSDVGSDRYFYVEKVNTEKGRFEEVFLLDKSKPGFPQIVNARSAHRDKGKWLLNDGILRKYNNDGYLSYELSFKEMAIQMNLNLIKEGEKSSVELSAEELKTRIAEFKSRNLETKALEVDYHLKYSIPLGTFFIALIAAPIGIKFARMGTYFGVAISIVLVFIWYITYITGKTLAGNGVIEPFLAAWIQNIGFGFLGIILLLRINKK